MNNEPVTHNVFLSMGYRVASKKLVPPGAKAALPMWKTVSLGLPDPLTLENVKTICNRLSKAWTPGV